MKQNDMMSDPFQALSDPTRRNILVLLKKERLTVNQLASNFDISRPAVSKHIKLLHRAGFLRIESLGRERFCVLDNKGFDRLDDWLEFFDDFWKNKFQSLQSLLDNRSDHRNKKGKV